MKSLNQNQLWRWFGVLGIVAVSTIALDLNQFSAIAQPQLNCNNPRTQRELNACEQQRWEAADLELNQIYQSLIPQLSNNRRQQLVKAQRAWIAFRDSECAFHSSVAEGGTMQPMLYYGCLANLTDIRNAELYRYERGQIPPALGENYQIADRQLNAVYQQLMDRLPSKRKNLLKTAELDWIEYRDALCEFERSGGGNAGFNFCRIRLTEVRVEQLEAHLDFLSQIMHYKA
ncbi:lysozyme inhibitor LprI family protein [Oxynema aestuarii]|jgi:uncharacterized protein YecT (DUF1311 family)|uniref:DUF1311 domain-containing protein n=1 Tax=Oxynema aestuarii AP17 TaxID=2064643 RepID=A0A6H1TUX3_9CYAN|nr:lysozyme inhibitor LprI family protein [Oxynema aestuarii]QIZ69947.1 DUF1311 domain-containing protein [Oxynema aestuarii AP17]RMH77506.1 MAG: DUF1311 domain-containing protein [Cyanobacteria bacterium J007]